MSKIRTCLWFEKGGEAAARFYCDLIPNSNVESAFKAQADAEALVVTFSLDGVPYQIINGGPHFVLNEAASIVYQTETQEETDRVWNALLGDTGVEQQCAWLKDQFGVSWQIVPKQLMTALSSPDREGAMRAQEAMFQMKKIDIQGIIDAFEGKN